LRWDLKQAFEMAVAEGILSRNPAKLLFTPRECPRPQIRIMAIEEVRNLFAVLEVRERLIAKLAVLAGMRPGEIFGLKWARLEAEYADIRQRVYRGVIDSPKSTYSVRWAALSDGLLAASKHGGIFRSIRDRKRGCSRLRSSRRPSSKTIAGGGTLRRI
jgi:integrase